MQTASVLVLGALLALGGCAAPVTAEGTVEVSTTTEERVEAPSAVLVTSWVVVIDPGVSPWRAEQLRLALIKWQAAATCGFSFEIVRRPVTSPILVTPETAPPPFEIDVSMADVLPQANATGWTGWSPGLGSRVTFRSDGADWDFPRAALHELGHALHLEHDDCAPSVMSSTSAYAEIEPADVAAISALWCR